MKDDTRLIHTRKDRLSRTIVNPPIERASTVLLPTRDTLYGEKPTYARMGLTVHRELEAAMCVLENAAHCRLTTNGLQACALAIASVVKSGDHVLISDSLYGPASRFCTRRLKAMGVEVTRFAPTLGAEIADLVQDNTKAIYLESPGSLTFDILDTPAIVRVAKNRNLITVFDNTWGVGLLYRPIDFGVDIVIQALTKYPVGHADALGGAVLTNDDRLSNQIATCAEDWGLSLSPDDAYMALRGLRTMPARLKAHEANAYTLAKWLAAHPAVDVVLHPGLPSHPGHALWKRDFKGANGLFGVILKATDQSKLDAMLEALKLFGMGFSWGGYESLLIPCCDQLTRMDEDPIHNRAGPLLRLHIGLEDTDDLIEDLSNAFKALA